MVSVLLLTLRTSPLTARQPSTSAALVEIDVNRALDSRKPEHRLRAAGAKVNGASQASRNPAPHLTDTALLDPPPAPRDSTTSKVTNSTNTAVNAASEDSALRLKVDPGLFSGVGSAGGGHQDPFSLYIAKLLLRLELNRIYPADAKRRGEQGEVEVLFRIAKTGSIEEIALETPSSVPRLNEAALETARRLGRLDPIPDSVSTRELVLIIPIRYRLR